MFIGVAACAAAVQAVLCLRQLVGMFIELTACGAGLCTVFCVLWPCYCGVGAACIDFDLRGKDTISIPEADGPQNVRLGFPTCLQASCKPGWQTAMVRPPMGAPGPAQGVCGASDTNSVPAPPLRLETPLW
jgi:hypothetical protein